MTISLSLARTLTEEEREALSHYGADSTYLHAVAQRCEGDLAHHPSYSEEWTKVGRQIKALDSAIAVSTLDVDAVLYSAQPVGFSTRGSLVGPAESFVGMTYRYPGFTSTSTETSFRDSFLSKRRESTSRPTTLEFHLPAGWNAIDLHEGGHSGEFELLLPRNLPYEVIEAAYVEGDVLNLILQPSFPLVSGLE